MFQTIRELGLSDGEIKTDMEIETKLNIVFSSGKTFRPFEKQKKSKKLSIKTCKRKQEK